MAKAPTSQDEFKFDARILQHQLRRGKIDPAEVEAYLASLPDEAEEAVESQVRFTTPYADRARGERG